MKSLAMGCAVSCLCLWPLLGRADEEELEPVEPAAEAGVPATGEELDRAGVEDARNQDVVTASGTAEAVSFASANVVTIGWEEIERRHYRSLAEILADVPGLYVVDDLVMPSLGVRGVTGGLRAGTRIVKVMINGVSVNFRPELTAFLGPEYLPVQMIERVEVAKGPLSALYGANAFVATVNVITRGQTGSSVVIEASGRGLAHRGGMGFGGAFLAGVDEGDRSLLVAVTADRFDRSRLRVARTFPEQDPELTRYKPFFADESRGDLASPRGLFAQLSASGALGTFFLQGGLQELDSMGEFQLNSVLTHRSRVALENLWTSARYEKQLGESVGLATFLAFSRGGPTGDERLYLTGTTDAFYERKFGYWALDGGGELAFALGEALSLEAGVDFSYEPQKVLYYALTANTEQGTLKMGDRIELVGPNDRREAKLSNYGAYAQAAWEPITDLRFTANVRLDVPNLFPAQPTWRLSVARRWSNAVVTRLVAGEAFQAPSSTLLFGLPGFGSANNVIGNRTVQNVRPLVPQRVASLEAVASFQPVGRLAIDGSVFAQRVDDKIEFVQAGPNFQARNQGTEEAVGAELSARFAMGPLTATGAAEVVRNVANGLLRRQPLPMYPAQRAWLELYGAWPDYHLSLLGRVTHVGPRGASQSNVYLNDDTPYSLPAFTTVDLGVSTLGLSFFGGAQTAFSLTVRNVLDARPSEPGFGGIDLPTLGRFAVLELRQTW